MTEKIEGFVLEVIKHSDRHNVVTLYTRSRGRISFLSPAPKGKISKMKNSRLMPLACVTADVRFRSDKSLQLLPAVSPVVVWRDLYFNPVKSSLVFFIAEFLAKILRQSPPDPNLWDYIRQTLTILDQADPTRIANFHIAFLVGMLDMLGIYPPVENYRPGLVFDLEKADFFNPTDLSVRKDSSLSPEESRFLLLLDRINLRNQHFLKMTAPQRRMIVDRLLKYFSLHLPFNPSLKSLDILHEVFS